MTDTSKMKKWLASHPRTFWLVVTASLLALIASTVFLTLFISRQVEARSHPSSPPKSFPEFAGKLYKATLKTEQLDGEVHFQLKATANEGSADDLRRLLHSKLGAFVRMHLSLQDAAGFSICETDVDHDRMIATEFDGVSQIQVNSTLPCEPESYGRVEKWAITSNIGAGLEALLRLKSETN